MKHSFQRKFYYKRNQKLSPNSKNKLKVGDLFEFQGKLYDDDKHTKELATTHITYKINKILTNGIVIETTNEYIFNENNKYGSGILVFKGKIFSPDFDKGMSYKTEPNMLLVKKGTKNYKDSFGYAKYVIDGNGVGDVVINIDILNK